MEPGYNGRHGGVEDGGSADRGADTLGEEDLVVFGGDRCHLGNFSRGEVASNGGLQQRRTIRPKMCRRLPPRRIQRGPKLSYSLPKMGPPKNMKKVSRETIHEIVEAL